MDRLARNAMLAKQAGMSYGQWKALQPRVPIVKEEKIPDGWILCGYCGKPFKQKRSNQQYCDVYCRERGYYEKELANQRRYREKRKAGAKNG